MSEDAPAEPAAVTVGYAFTPKKVRSFMQPGLIGLARARGVQFMPIDPAKPIESQEGHPFDVILHKLPVAERLKCSWEERVRRYADDNPRCVVLDAPERVHQLANRATMLQAVQSISYGERFGGETGTSGRSSSICDGGAHSPELRRVRAPEQLVVEGDPDAVVAAMRAKKMRLPLLAKALMADGSANSHSVAVVYDETGLRSIVRGEVAGLRPPCILQQFVNHGGTLFKVYVVGESVTCTRRASLPDLHGTEGERARRGAGGGAVLRGAGRGGFELIERISSFLGAGNKRAAADMMEGGGAGEGDGGASGTGGTSSAEEGEEGTDQDEAEELEPPPRVVAPPEQALINSISASLRAQLGLQLFNYDLIRDASTDDYLVVDINYLPGFAKMPNYETVFANFLSSVCPVNLPATVP
mmetsp:Transcript_30912/g.100630  ORF Transcript_30912/g.100630 Transcript_30912/m.100630 type:complete len:415 (+) Transcript_30912:15-1259(+)